MDLKEGRNAKILCTQVESTVQRNFEGYSRKEFLQAIKARNLQGMIGGPARADYKGTVCEKMIDDCLVNIYDLKMLKIFFDPSWQI